MALFIVLTEVFLSVGICVATFIMLTLAAVFCYAAVFAAFSAYDRAVALRLAPVVSDVGVDNIDEIAMRMSWKREATEKIIKKCRKKGYIT